MTTQAIVVEKYVMEEKDKRIAELEAEVERLNFELNCTTADRVTRIKENELLTASLREACAGLEFYGNPDNWEAHDAYFAEEQGYLWQSRFLSTPQDYSNTVGTIMTAGKQARTTLASLKARHPNLGETKDE